jgi:hypothetical protein
MAVKICAGMVGIWVMKVEMKILMEAMFKLIAEI